jgi:hypothetical protein
MPFPAALIRIFNRNYQQFIRYEPLGGLVSKAGLLHLLFILHRAIPVTSVRGYACET